MQDVSGPVPVRQRHGDDLDSSTQELPQLADPRSVGAVPLPDREGPLVEPYNVASLQASVARDPAQDRQARLSQESSERLRLAAALRLSHAAQHDAPVGDDRRVARVDRIEPGRIVPR